LRDSKLSYCPKINETMKAVSLVIFLRQPSLPLKTRQSIYYNAKERSQGQLALHHNFKEDPESVERKILGGIGYLTNCWPEDPITRKKHLRSLEPEWFTSG
jgi:hypothetical protein